MPYERRTSARTLRRWVAAYRSASESSEWICCSSAGLRGPGNRNAKLPELSQQLMLEFIDKHYENLKQRTRSFSVVRAWVGMQNSRLSDPELQDVLPRGPTHVLVASKRETPGENGPPTRRSPSTGSWS